tara:strand:+ start:1223 stop:2245 length:1023 start_codon:yes stop_codon:yes gene_type:complete
MAKINFTAGGVSRKLKATPAKYRQSPGRPNISQSDGVRPAFPLMPWKGMNGAGYEDVSTGDQVVIPKGRIVSAITANGGADVIGDGSTYYGVGKGVMGLIVPANGGATRDVSAEYNEAGCLAAGLVWDGSDCATLTLDANAPIGVVEHDVFMDEADGALNYQSRNKNWGVLSHQLIKVPYVDATAWNGKNGLTDDAVDDPDSMGTVGAVYKALEKKYSFMVSSGKSGKGLAGALIAADNYGNYKEVTTVTAQNVGKLMGVDYRFNKDLLDTVQSKWEDDAGYRTAGTGTKGIPQFLYDFVYDALVADSGYTVDAATVGNDIYTMCVTDKIFGEAWILINV